MTDPAPVLVVDDHPDTGAMLLRLLRRRGIDAAAVDGGYSALAALTLGRPRVVIMDEMMPDLGGLEVVRRMRADPQTADVAVVFYSASYDHAKEQEARRLGARAWLVKGVNRLDELLDAVVACCRAADGDGGPSSRPN